jgi:sec-independent protein translocase protein TatC
MVAVTKKKQEKEKSLTLLGHLQEIRRRLFYSVIALIITIAISFYFSRDIFDFLVSRSPPEVPLIAITPTEMIGIWFNVCLYGALVLAMPFFIFQLVLFIRPALTRKERVYLYALIPAVFLFFLGGAAFAWFVFLPNALDFLLHFMDGIVTYQIKIGSLIMFEVQIIFWMGVVFELPVVTFFLAKIGILNYRWLAKQWKWAFVGSFVIGAAITPTPDPINCTIVSVPVFLLYLLGILTAWIARPGQKSTA